MLVEKLKLNTVSKTIAIYISGLNYKVTSIEFNFSSI